MKDYYKPVDFSDIEEKEEAPNKKEDSFPTKEEFQPALDKIRILLDDLANGSTVLVPYRVQWSKDNSVEVSFSRFESNPSKETMKEFLKMVIYHVGNKALVKFEDIITRQLEVIEDGKSTK